MSPKLISWLVLLCCVGLVAYQIWRDKKEKMNIHGFKLRVKEIKEEIREVEKELSKPKLKQEEKAFLIRRKNNLIRKKNTHLNTIKSLKQERTLRKNGRGK